MNKKILIVIISICLLIVVRVIYLKISRKEIIGIPPVKSVELFQNWVTIKPVEGYKIQDFVDIKLFHGFGPNINFNRAKNLFGEPKNIRNDEHGEYYEYWFDDSRIEIGREEYAEGEGTGINWSLYLYPSQKSYKDFLSPSILKYINPKNEKINLQILDNNGDVQMVINILGERVDLVIWYK
jgi:hypothetical protein